MPTESQISIESHGQTLYGMVYMPSGTPGGSVVLCYPLFEERKSAGRLMVNMARTLCADGFAVLTFDYRGCGDSAGEFSDFSIPHWLADIATAIDFLRQRSPATPLGLLGLRLGASLALQTAANRSDIDFVVLWEPILNGREHLEQELRKKLVKEMMTFGKGRDSRSALLKALGDGDEIDFDGYPITPELYQDLRSLDLNTAASHFKKRSLMVQVTSQSTPSKPMVQLQETLQQAGASNELRLVNEPPFWNLVGVMDGSSIIRETQIWVRQSLSLKV
jgi:exosortase A-associated hydrolase 2